MSSQLVTCIFECECAPVSVPSSFFALYFISQVKNIFFLFSTNNTRDVDTHRKQLCLIYLMTARALVVLNCKYWSKIYGLCLTIFFLLSFLVKIYLFQPSCCVMKCVCWYAAYSCNFSTKSRSCTKALFHFNINLYLWPKVLKLSFYFPDFLKSFRQFRIWKIYSCLIHWLRTFFFIILKIFYSDMVEVFLME